MPVGGETLVAGPYTVTWGGVALGIQEGAGGFMSMTLEEYKAGPISAWWPYSATLGRMGVIGRLMYSISAALVLTAVAGTSASTSPATLTASKAILLPGFGTRLMYGPTL